jgi:hypothetical protein
MIMHFSIFSPRNKNWYLQPKTNKKLLYPHVDHDQIPTIMHTPITSLTLPPIQKKKPQSLLHELVLPLLRLQPPFRSPRLHNPYNACTHQADDADDSKQPAISDTLDGRLSDNTTNTRHNIPKNFTTCRVSTMSLFHPSHPGGGLQLLTATALALLLGTNSVNIVVATEKTSILPRPKLNVAIIGTNQKTPPLTAHPYHSRAIGNRAPATHALRPMRSSGKNSSGASESGLSDAARRFRAARRMMASFQEPPTIDAIRYPMLLGMYSSPMMMVEKL